MVEKQTVLYSSIAGLLVLISVLGGVNLLDDDVYYCEDRQIAMVCESLSAYYGLANGKCVNENVGNKVCRSGWSEIVDDTNESISLDTLSKTNITIEKGNTWDCEKPEGSTEIPDFAICRREGHQAQYYQIKNK